MKLISYYDLLGMVKEENIPDIIYLHMLGKKVAYIKNVDMDEFNGYMLDDPNKDQNEDFKYWLGECFLESDMFKECIEIKETFEEIMLNAQKVIIDAFSRLIEPIKKVMEIEELDLKDAEEEKGIKKIDTNIPCAYEIESTLRDKLNEVIDAVNKLNKGE